MCLLEAAVSSVEHRCDRSRSDSWAPGPVLVERYCAILLAIQRGIQDEMGSIPALRESDDYSSCELDRERLRQLHHTGGLKAWTAKDKEMVGGRLS